MVNVFSYFPNVYKQIIVKKRSSLQRFFKDDIRKLADLKQQISQQMILRLQHIAKMRKSWERKRWKWIVTEKNTGRYSRAVLWALAYGPWAQGPKCLGTLSHYHANCIHCVTESVQFPSRKGLRRPPIKVKVNVDSTLSNCTHLHAIMIIAFDMVVTSTSDLWP